MKTICSPVDSGRLLHTTHHKMLQSKVKPRFYDIFVSSTKYLSELLYYRLLRENGSEKKKKTTSGVVVGTAVTTGTKILRRYTIYLK
jgi:hypothetical protein